MNKKNYFSDRNVLKCQMNYSNCYSWSGFRQFSALWKTEELKMTLKLYTMKIVFRVWLTLQSFWLTFKFKQSKFIDLLDADWVNSPNSGCLLNIGNGPQSGPHCIVRPSAAKWPINLWWDQKPQSNPSVCNAANGRKVAHRCAERPISGIW